MGQLRIMAVFLLGRSVTTYAFVIPCRHTSSTEMTTHKIWSTINPDAVHTDDEDEWHPQDPAWTTPRLLQGIWDQIAHANTMVKGETDTVIYPEMQEKFAEPRFLNLLMAHLDACKDVCDNFGITTTLLPYQKEGKIVGFTVKSFRNPEKKDDFDFDYDPFWDDGTDFEALYDGIDDEDMPKDKFPEIVDKVPSDDEKIISITKSWVGKLMSDMGVCPFTSGPDSSGVPLGNVFYCVDRSTSFEDMYASFWKEVVRVEQNNEKELSTTLLIAPEFCLDHLESFESFTSTLTQPLTALGIEDLIQLIFFHPQYSFRDGDARSSEQGQAANYARRSPWPMINILRTTQVRAAQKGIPTGLVYKQNEKTLAKIGSDRLETMLRLRDWSEIADFKVNRREYDALKIAQDYQATGAIRQEDQSIAHDATPAANRVDRKQVDQGNLVNVVMQAMEKRLGKGENGVTPLTGPETSAASMATDFLLEELDRISAGAELEPGGTVGEPPGQTEASDAVKQEEAVVPDEVAGEKAKASESAANEAGASETVKEVAEPASTGAHLAAQDVIKEYKETDELRKAKEERMEKARSAIFDELREAEEIPKNPTGCPDAVTDVLFGGEGISKAIDEGDELFQEGMNPDSFY